MNTEQNYVGGGTNATPNPETAQNAAQTTHRPDKHLPIPAAEEHQPLIVTKQRAQWELDELLKEGKITEDQHSWGSVIPIPDDSMGPPLLVGGAVALYLLDPAEFEDKVGRIVAVTTQENPGAYVLGRLQNVNKRTIKLSRTDKAFADLTINRRDIGQLHEALYALGTPLR